MVDKKVIGKGRLDKGRRGVVMSENKDAEGKAPWHLVSLKLLEGIAFVREYGNEKYEPDSWMQVEDAEQKYYGAMMRHAGELVNEDGVLDIDARDSETGMPHIWAFMTNAYFLEHFRRKGEACPGITNKSYPMDYVAGTGPAASR